MWSWIIGGVLLIIAGLYFGVSWVQTLGIGMIALPIILVALVLLIILIGLSVFLVIGLIALLRSRRRKRK